MNIVSVFIGAPSGVPVREEGQQIYIGCPSFIKLMSAVCRKSMIEFLLLRLFLFYDALSVKRSLCRSQSCDRNAERGAGHVVEPYAVAEFNCRRIAAVLAADTAF